MFEGSTLGSLDILMFAASLGVTMLIGLYFANKNKTFADYATGGGNQNLWAVSASMAAGYCSALTLIGNPSELYMHGTSFTLKMATTLLAWPVSSFVFLPVFRRLDGISIFQYIENRFHPLLRRFVALLFIFQMTFYSAITLYLPSLPLYAALGIPQSISIGLVGCICIVYCTFGGIKAVTWSNLYHSILLIVTMVLIILVGAYQSGGLAKVLHKSIEGGRLSLGNNYFQFDLTTRHTIFNTMFGYTLIRLFLHGTSQMQVQSALSLSTIKRSQLAQLLSALLYLLIQAVASAIGLLLYVNYKNCDPYLSGQIKRQDELMAHYVSTSLGSIPGLQGAFIAAIFGSTLTSMSSFQSSTSAMLVEDFIRPLFAWLRLGPLSDQLAAALGKLMAFSLGLTCILLTFEMDRISGLQQATTTLYGVIGMPVLATFLLGACTRFINGPGMFAGMLAALSFGLFVFAEQVLRGAPLEPSLATSTAGCRAEDNLPALLAAGSGSPSAGRTLLATAPSWPTNASSYLPTTGGRQQAAPANMSDLVAFASSLVGAPERLASSATGSANEAANGVASTQSAPTAVLSWLGQHHQRLIGAGHLAAPLAQDQPMHREPMDLGASLAQMSYLWLPLFTLSIATVVATLVSLLTGGARQQVDASHLAPFFKFQVAGGAKGLGQATDDGQRKQSASAKQPAGCCPRLALAEPRDPAEHQWDSMVRTTGSKQLELQCCRCQQAIGQRSARIALGISLISVNYSQPNAAGRQEQATG